MYPLSDFLICHFSDPWTPVSYATVSAIICF